jgi:uncharacterized membrane-anchored protein YhcB (DUF1043 family)
MDSWMWIGAALLLGAVLGAATYAWTMRRDRFDRETVNRLRAELEEYREEVTEHFVETAQLVNNLTRSYKAVYDHLEHGAYRLVGDEKLRKELGYVESEPVKLEYIGRRKQSAIHPRTADEVPPAADGEGREGASEAPDVTSEEALEASNNAPPAPDDGSPANGDEQPPEEDRDALR